MSALYDYEKRIHHALYGDKGIMKSRKIPEENKRTLLKYYEFLKASQRSLPRQDKILRTLKRFAEILGDRRFEDVVKEDMVAVMAKVTGKPATIRDFQILVRQFYRWLRDYPKRRYPPEVAWFEIHEPKSNLTRSDLLTSKEINKMIAATQSFRNKALIGTADELGGRIGELLSLKIRDVKIAETHVELALNGKTGPRPGYLIRRAALFCEWFDAHPQKNQSEAWLWSENGEPFKYDAARFMLRYVAKKAGIKKRVYWTLFRHSSATSDADFLTDQQLKAKFGWTPGSRQPGTYTHLAGRDILPALLKRERIGKKKEPEPRVKPCPNEKCGFPNDPEALRCVKCGSALGVKDVISLREQGQLVLKLSEQVKDLQREIFRMRRGHLYGTRLNDAELEKAMEEEEKLLEELRKHGLLVKIGKDGKIIPSLPKDKKN